MGRESCCWRVRVCFQPGIQHQQCREKYVLGLPAGNNKKMLSDSFSWEVVPGAAALESLKSVFECTRAPLCIKNNTQIKHTAQEAGLLLAVAAQGTQGCCGNLPACIFETKPKKQRHKRTFARVKTDPFLLVSKRPLQHVPVFLESQQGRNTSRNTGGTAPRYTLPVLCLPRCCQLGPADSRCVTEAEVAARPSSLLFCDLPNPQLAAGRVLRQAAALQAERWRVEKSCWGSR